MPKRLFALIPASLLIAVALWEIVATRTATAVPGDPDWDAASAILRSHYQPGDLIVFAPRWVDPVGRLHVGDLIPLDMAARMDAARYPRIWELSIRGAQAREVADATMVEEFPGPVTVRRYARIAPAIVADLVESVALAEPKQRVDLVEAAFEPHRCLVTPVSPNKPVKITFKNLALGNELVGYVGIADVFLRREDRAPITLEVSAAGKTATAIAPIDTWTRFALPTAPGSGDVTFTLHWESDRPWPPKQICFTAEARK